MWTAHNGGKREGLQEGIQQGIQQGREEGIELGVEKGEHQANVVMAKSLLEQGVSVQTISIATGFTIDIIGQLKQGLE